MKLITVISNTRSTWNWRHFQGYGFKGQGHRNFFRWRHIVRRFAVKEKSVWEF